MAEVVIMEITNENEMNVRDRAVDGVAGQPMPMLVSTQTGEAVIVQASMSQVEMTVWLCIMAVLAIGMLAILAIVE